MSIGKERYQSRYYLAVGVLAACLIGLSGGACADSDIGVTQLLKSGYEIKAAYTSPGQVAAVHVLILQKSSSAYQCTTYSSTLGRFKPYSNTYSCSQVQDLIPAG